MIDGFSVVIYDDTLGVQEIRHNLTWQEAQEDLRECINLLLTIEVGQHFIEGHIYKEWEGERQIHRCLVLGCVRPSGIR